jgi:hypothetical protein
VAPMPEFYGITPQKNTTLLCKKIPDILKKTIDNYDKIVYNKIDE